MFPVFGVACWAAVIAGALGLTWYESLSNADKAEADRLAAGLAQELFDKTVEELTQHEMRIVNNEILKRL